ncbi:MAG: hypothetical protein H7Y27_06375, partial [Gemmatimonadaceae bacterium]|nr:hypothetical protein [Chitinophagaceae bacterium]
MGFLFYFNRKRNENAGSTTMMTAGHIVTLMGIVFSLIICTILLSVMIPGLYSPGLAGKVLADAPANTEGGKTHGLVFKVIVNAIVGNAAGGLFAS